jgi:hypothetical protein
MSRPTVRKQVELPAGVTPIGVSAHLRLIAATTGEAFGYAGTANVDVGGVDGVRADSSGLITFTNVRPNSGVSSDVITSPANTVYQLVTTIPGRPSIVEYLAVPDSAGPLWAQDILTTAPASLPPAGSVTTAELNAAIDAIEFDDLADVNMTGLADGQVPTWNAGTSEWIPGTGGGGGGSMTGAQILTALAPVDGSGSGLDADTLDGVDSTSFVRDTGSETIAGVKTFSSTPVVPDASWTLAKLANVATARILGRTTASSGVIEELTASQAKALLAIAISDVASLQAALDALQPLDSDLTTIAGLTATTDNMIQSVGSAWASRTPTQVKAALAIASGDVSGLGALATLSAVGSAQITDGAIVDGDINASAAIALTKLAAIADQRILGNVSGGSAAAIALTAAQVKTFLSLAIADVASLQTALDGKQALDSDLTTIAGLTATTDNFIVAVSSAWASRTPAQVKATLALDNVTNTSDANKPVSTAQQTALDLKADLSITANGQSGTTYTLVLTDQGKVIECNNGSAITLTVPTNASVAFPTGTVIEVYQQGAGQITVAAAGGVTLRAPGGAKTRVQYSTVSLRKRASDEWVLTGDSTS